MWYNRNIPIKDLTKGGIFMPKEKLIKYVCLTFRASLPEILRKADDKADKIAENKAP